MPKTYRLCNQRKHLINVGMKDIESAKLFERIGGILAEFSEPYRCEGEKLIRIGRYGSGNHINTVINALRAGQVWRCNL